MEVVSTMSSCPVEEHFSAGDFLKDRRRQLSAMTPAIGPHPRPKCRIGRTVTQEEVAEAIGVSRVWYALIEAGRGDVSPRLLGRIADALMLGRDDRLELLRLVYPGFC
jgi:DNA-binding XRE family transcriptional regulator